MHLLRLLLLTCVCAAIRGAPVPIPGFDARHDHYNETVDFFAGDHVLWGDVEAGRRHGIDHFAVSRRRKGLFFLIRLLFLNFINPNNRPNLDQGEGESVCE